MAKRTKTAEEIIENITQTTLEDVMHRSMMPYAEHVILERALPRAEDGLKPVQRRILYTMYELGLTPDKPHRKCARIVGDCLGKYHPHGDSSVYDALSRMAQDFSMRYMLVDGHGNFGSIDGDSPAAMRYTEARMQALSLEMLRDINKNTVPFVLNFEDELQEPDLLPARFPNLLVNGSSGIAVGLATNIPPHNLTEAIQATIAMLENPDISVTELMQYVKAPDFPTGGSILQSDEIFNAYSTGKGKIKVRAKLHVESSVGGRSQIVITEIPYQVNKSSMLEKIQRLTEDKGPLFGKIYSIRDESDRSGMRAVVETKKDIDPNTVIALLFKYSDLEVTFGINLVAIAGGKPKLLSLREIIAYYIKHQKEVVLNRTKYDLEKSKIRAHILEGLLIALDNIDEVIRIIRQSKTPKLANSNLQERFALSETQAQAILDMRLQRLTNLEVITLRDEFEKLMKLIAQLEAIIQSEKKLVKLLIKELKEVQEKNHDERRTAIIEDEFADVVIAPEPEKIVEYMVSFTADHKIQKYLLKDFNSRLSADALEVPGIFTNVSPLNSNDKLMVFTNLGNVYQLSAESIPQVSKKTDRGLMLNAIISGYAPDEKMLYFTPLCQTNPQRKLVIVTQNGMIKASTMEEYLINRAKYSSIKLKEGDEIVSVFTSDMAGDILIGTKQGNAIRFGLQGINDTGRMTAGVGAIQLAEDDAVCYAEEILEQSDLFVISEKGYAKSIPLADIETQHRNGKGFKVINLLKNRSNGSYISKYKLYMGDLNILVQQSKSGFSRIRAADVPIQNKSGKGMPVVISVLDDIIKKAYTLEHNEVE